MSSSDERIEIGANEPLHEKTDAIFRSKSWKQNPWICNRRDWNWKLHQMLKLINRLVLQSLLLPKCACKYEKSDKIRYEAQKRCTPIFLLLLFTFCERGGV